MTTKSLLRQLLDFDFDALAELEALAQGDKYRAAIIAWTFLLKAGEDGRHVAGGFPEKAISVLMATFGRHTTELVILDSWGSLADQARENIYYGPLEVPTLFSNEFGKRLFYSSGSSIGDKSEILCSLARSRCERGISDTELEEMLATLNAAADQTTRKWIARVADDLGLSL